MIRYRRFRNTDPPALVAVWNEAFPNRGAIRLRSATSLECGVFAKPYFDPAGLIVAEEDGRCVGFAHAGFGPLPTFGELATPDGVICLIGVHPQWQRRGIGTELVRHCETYLRDRGAQTFYAGPHAPLNPFYLGLYGGSDSVGFLTSDPAAEPFFRHCGYQLCRSFTVLQRHLADPIKIVDPRFAAFRQRFEVRIGTRKTLGGWWQECLFSLIEPVEFFLHERQTGDQVARALIWEMEGFGERWNRAAIGLVNLEIQADQRRHGLGKYMLCLLLRHLQEQFFALLETHVPRDNAAGLAFFRSLAFEEVDVGNVFCRKDNSV